MMNYQGHARILVLDDEPLMRELLVAMLDQVGFAEVTTCASGPECIARVERTPQGIDLIMLDLNMPDMDGIEVLRRLAELRFTGSVLLVSGEDDMILESAERLVRAHNISSLGHVRKPVPLVMLASLVQRWQPRARHGPRDSRKIYAADEVRAAIAASEFVNVYQPKIAVASGALVGVETLVRWQHPHDGIVYPDQFIGVAEAHGLIDELTSVVLAAALAQARHWMDAGLALHVAVNVSTDSLASLNFPDQVEAQALAAGVPAADIVLEITETRLMPRLATVLDVLTRLRLKRFRLAIDDFGTGHSSLAQLRDIPVDELKVDRGFIHGASGDDKRRAICDVSRDLARRLGIAMVAEGVEDQADWDFVRREGCDLAQGYYIARPMPGSELPQWADDWARRAPVLLGR